MTTPTASDYVRQTVHVGCNCSVKVLKALANVALSPKTCRERGITLTLNEDAWSNNTWFTELVARTQMRPLITEGSRIVLNDNCAVRPEGLVVDCRPTFPTWRGVKSGQSPRPCTKVKGQVVSAIDSDRRYWRVKFSQIDWTKTAEINRVILDLPVSALFIESGEVVAA